MHSSKKTKGFRNNPTSNVIYAQSDEMESQTKTKVTIQQTKDTKNHVKDQHNQSVN